MWLNNEEEYNDLTTNAGCIIAMIFFLMPRSINITILD